MKRSISILALTLCFCLIGGCGAEDVLNRMTEGRAEAAAQVTAAPVQDSSTDMSALPMEQMETESPSDAVAAQPDNMPRTELSGADLEEGSADYTALPPEECVEDAWPEAGVMPRINLNCPGADAINQAIQDQFFSVAEDPLWQLHYLVGKGAGHVLSVVMVKQANDWTEYTPYNLDMTTGQALTGAELLDLLDVNVTAFANLELAVMGEEFTHQFGMAQDQQDPDFYNQQYARTTAADNTELERVWFSGDGQLCFAGRIYGLAGAEYYEYQLSSGLTF